MYKQFLWRILLSASLLFSPWLWAAAPTASAQEEDGTAVARLLASMSTAERVGQLFLVTFRGDTAVRGSDIADLIANYRVGGIVLLAENDNITGYGEAANVPIQVADLANQLQTLSLQGPFTAVAPPDPNLDADAIPPTAAPELPHDPIPLFIALNYEGNGSPHTAILSGLTQIPSNMAIGATWNPGYAQTVGQVVGRDLTALGVNMLLGPSLDVLETPQPGSTADMGVRSFGGDPYWVGLMGQAYISGVHQGSNNRMAVIAKHFPGNGSSDRPVDDEVPTVRKSLEQLKQIELAPFFAVTNGRTNSAATVDGLLTTHIRYQGFQGNIRATTVPVSFDPQALKTLMSLDAFTSWRQSGGVIVSDSLGVRSVEKFYDDTEREFPHRRIAKDALLAGNDLLYLSEFALGKGDFAAELANIKDTIIWFREKYETDTSFAQRVDEAVLRILQLKLRLYGGDFSEENILQDTASLSRIIEPANATMLGLAQAAITLISPSQAELVERLASPPGLGDQIIIFTDERQVQQCSACAPISIIGKTALEQRILSLYGPGATAQVQPNQIRSFSFAELAAFLAAGPGGVFPVMTPTAVTPTAVTPTAVTPTAPIPIDITETAEPTEDALPTFTPTATATATPPPEYWVQEWLRDATWIIFAVQNKTEASLVLHQFLAQRTDLIRGRKVIVFAYDAPYYLDTTEISKLTAYFGLYNKSSAAIDTSVRALFQEIPLPGALPVSVPGIGYDLFRQTQPNAQQLIELFIISDSGLVQSPPGEAPLDASVGDTLHLQTGVIRDQNGNAVPDGTIVQFIQQDRIQGLVNIIANVSTSNGLAVFDYILEARTGQFRITAVSGNATRSQAVDIIIEDDAQVRIITPTPAPTETPAPTPTPTSTPTPTFTPTPEPTTTPIPEPLQPPEPGVRIAISELQMLASLLTGLTAVLVLSLVIGQKLQADRSQQVGWSLWGLAGALLLYNYFGLGLPGTAVFANLGSWGGLFTTLFGGVMGIALYWVSNWGLYVKRET